MIASGLDEKTHKEAANIVYNSLIRTIPVFLKECKSHVFRAPSSWVQRNKALGNKDSKDWFRSLLCGLFNSVLVKNRITVLIARLSVVIAILETETFFLNEQTFFDGNSTPTEKPARDWIQQEIALANDLDLFIEDESKKFMLSSLEDVNRILRSPDMASNHINLHNEIIGRAKDTIAKKMCCVYLKSIASNNGSLLLEQMGVCYLWSWTDSQQ